MSTTYSAKYIPSVGETFAQALSKAIAKRSKPGVRRLLKCAEDHICEAQLIGWPALAESWQPELEQARAAYAALGGKR